MPLVADFFADDDTREIAHACRKLDDLKRGFQWKTLRPALEALAEEAPSPPLGVAICGAGFEDRTPLLAKIAERWPLLGNAPSVVERVKDPELFFAELSRLGVPHPRTITDPAAAGDGWLAKRQGGAGGSHVVATPARRKDAGRLYYQEQIEGRPVSALFVGAGDRACVLGFSEQWAAPTKHSKWRYGGAAQPAELSPELKARLTEQVERVAATFGLNGHRQRRLPGQRRGGLSAGNQPAAWRHARYLRQRGGTLAPHTPCGCARAPASRRPPKIVRGERLGHRLRNRTPDGVTIDGLAGMDRRSACLWGLHRQEPPDMHCVGAS